MNKLQRAARDLHALGFKTLPIRPGTKAPATRHGVKDATDDDAATDAYYGVNPSHGIGVCGDGLLIFDFDVKPGIDGREQLRGFDLPPTLTQTTPSGGLHMIYSAAEPVRPTTNKYIAVDIRGNDSYIVCAPTPGYEWADIDAPIAPANAEVMRFYDHVRTCRGDR